MLLRTFYIFLGAIAGFLLFASLEAGSIYNHVDSVRDLGRLPPVDVVVCLSGGRGRIRAAGEFWVRAASGRETPPFLYFSGIGPGATLTSIGAQLSTEAVELTKRFPRQVFLEALSSNTRENAEVFKGHALQFSWKRILLITSGYHMERAERIFRKTLDPHVGIETYSVVQDPYTKKSWKKDADAIRLTLLEYLKLMFYKLSEPTA